MVLPELPRELQLRILAEARRLEAVARIQAVWRGRDVRDWLWCPWSLAYNKTHPLYKPKRSDCPACIAGRANIYLEGMGVHDSERKIWAWACRRPWISHCYAPHGGTRPYDGDTVDFHVFFLSAAELSALRPHD